MDVRERGLNESGGFQTRLTRIPQERTFGSMKTTIDIPEKEMRDAIRFTKAKTKREAIVKVLEGFNRQKRMAELVKYSGTCKDMMSFEELMELRERDLPKSSRLYSK